MSLFFAETLRQLRNSKGYSQQQLAEKMIVDRSTVAKWEAGSRLPDANTLVRLSGIFGVDADILFNAAAKSDEAPNVVLLDDEEIILRGGLPILEKVLPNAVTVGFTSPRECVEYAKHNPVALAFLDIEMGRVSGLDLCRELLEINSHTNVVFLTGYRDYAFDAWEVGACGFLMKPLTEEAVRRQLPLLRYKLPVAEG